MTIFLIPGKVIHKYLLKGRKKRKEETKEQMKKKRKYTASVSSKTNQHLLSFIFTLQSRCNIRKKYFAQSTPKAF